MALVKMRDGEELNVITIGRGKPVMLLHGFASRGSHWLPNVLPLTGKFRFYLPDLRGFGASHHARLDPADVFTTYAHDVQDVLEHFQLDKVILGGISTGAYTCLNYNHQYGFERVEKYLNIEHSPNSRNTCSNCHGIFRERQETIFAQFQSLLDLAHATGYHTQYWDLPVEARTQFRDTVVALMRRAVNRPLSRRVVSLAGRYVERGFTRHVMPVERWQVYLSVMAAFMQGGDTLESLEGIRVPTTLMVGRHSRFFTLESQLQIARKIPHANVVVFEKSGHVPILDEPIRFQREFTRFMLG